MDARVEPAHDPCTLAGTSGYRPRQLAPNARLPYDAGEGLT